VRVLLDEQLPRQLAPYLVGHDASTVQQQGWAGLKNGELLKQAELRGFEVFLTADQNLAYQQNLTSSRLFVIVLVAPSNAFEDLLPAVPTALAAMAEPTAGQPIRIGS
jgi:predicted nuclease of predicted toxin-antitoxin system